MSRQRPQKTQTTSQTEKNERLRIAIQKKDRETILKLKSEGFDFNQSVAKYKEDAMPFLVLAIPLNRPATPEELDFFRFLLELNAFNMNTLKSVADMVRLFGAKPFVDLIVEQLEDLEIYISAAKLFPTTNAITRNSSTHLAAPRSEDKKTKKNPEITLLNEAVEEIRVGESKQSKPEFLEYLVGKKKIPSESKIGKLAVAAGIEFSKPDKQGYLPASYALAAFKLGYIDLDLLKEILHSAKHNTTDKTGKTLAQLIKALELEPTTSKSLITLLFSQTSIASSTIPTTPSTSLASFWPSDIKDHKVPEKFIFPHDYYARMEPKRRIMASIKYGDTAAIDYFSKLPNFEINHIDTETGLTPINYAISLYADKNMSREFLDKLLDCGVDLEQQDGFGKTPFLFAQGIGIDPADLPERLKLPVGQNPSIPGR